MTFLLSALRNLGSTFTRALRTPLVHARPAPRRAICPGLEELESRLPLSSGATFHTFDRPGTPFKAGQEADPPPPTVLSGGASGNFLRLATTTIPNSNNIAFRRTAVGRYRRMVSDFDFRITPGSGRADGLGFALLPTLFFGNRGAVAPPAPFFVPEDPAFRGALGVGFDIHPNLDLGDTNGNHVSIHFGGRTLAQVDATPVVDLASGSWIHARIAVRAKRRGADVTVTLTPLGGASTTLIDRLRVTGFKPYEARAWFGARSGGLSADHDIDNIRVRFSRLVSQ